MEALLQELKQIDAQAALQADYQKTLALLRAIKAGDISLDNVTMTDNGWTVEDRLPPPEPAEDITAEPPTEKADG